ncbi:MAG: recombinase family protein [Actinomycetota bacterium]|nr:recombinase family protein [Actinomycetota bacterium]
MAQALKRKSPPAELAPAEQPKRAVVYLRVSTTKQAEKAETEEGYSLPAQRGACYRKAAQLGAIVVDEYVDLGESAKTADRPGLQAMLQRIREVGDVDLLIVHKVDRLARNREDDVIINAGLRAAGVRLVSVTENIDETPSGKLLHGIMSSIAEFYSSNLATEILKGTVQKAAEGGTPFLAPIGYLNVRKFVDGKEFRTVEKDPERAPLVQHAFELYATGEYSLKTLLVIITKAGLRQRATRTRPERPLRLGQLSKILHNPYYIGITQYRGVENEGKHPPLVGRELFDRVQAVLRAHNKAGEKQRTHNHYLKGILCNRCLARLCLTNAKGRYLYFFCATRHKHSACDLPYQLAHEVEDAIIDYYGTVQVSPKRLRTVRAGLQAEIARQRRRTDRAAKRAQIRLSQLRAERERLLQAFYASAIPLDLLKAEQERIGREMLEAERAVTAAETDWAYVEETIEIALELLANCAQEYEAASPATRRLYNQALFEQLKVDEDKVEGEFVDQFEFLLTGRVKRRQEAEADRQPVLAGIGSNKEPLVDLTGFEPPADSRSDLATAGGWTGP